MGISYGNASERRELGGVRQAVPGGARGMQVSTHDLRDLRTHSRATGCRSARAALAASRTGRWKLAFEMAAATPVPRWALV